MSITADYLAECITDLLPSDALTVQQIDDFAANLKVSIENYSDMASGPIPNPLESQMAEQKRWHQKAERGLSSIIDQRDSMIKGLEQHILYLQSELSDVRREAGKP